MKKHEKSLYIAGGKPVHKLSFCAFLDVLGFSERTKESYKEGAGDELLQDFHATFGEVTATLKAQAAQSYALYYKSFSDNVLLAVPRYSPDMESESGHILTAASEYQFQMALKGFFVRGGIAVGPLFIDDNSVYGGALIEAYKLENKMAVNPIVVLCDDTMKLVDKHLSYYADDWAPQRRMILVNADGRYFINYLGECINDADDGWELDIESLALHRDRIQFALTKYVKQAPVFAKFSWLSAYHNYFCDTVSGFSNYSEDLKVSKDMATVSFAQLGRRCHSWARDDDEPDVAPPR